MWCYSWNVNGIRAAGKKGFCHWLAAARPDILCVQETKAHREQVEPDLQTPPGYDSVWHSARKRGYSGVAAYFTPEWTPQDVQPLGDAAFDDEGRAQALIYADWVLINAYFPNSQADRKRLDYKLAFFDAISEACRSYRDSGKHVVLCGDYNVSHKDIDLARPDANRDNPGFYPEECAAMDAFLAGGFVDIFRETHPDEPEHYTWWSYRTRARERNIGWRLDYHCIDEALRPQVVQSIILADVPGSDHCPVALELDGAL